MTGCQRAISRDPNRLTPVVDGESDPVRVAAKRWEFPNLALFPEDRLKLEDLGGHAGWVVRGILCSADRLASVIDLKRCAVITTQCGERRHRTVFPEEGET